MAIKASAVYDYKTTKALVHLSIYKKKNPTKQIVLWIIYLSIVSLITVSYQLLFSGPATIWYLFGALILFSALSLLMHFYLPKRAHRAQGKFADAKVSYVFKDDEMTVTSSAEASGEKNDENSSSFKGKYTAKYSMIYKVMETNAYLFIFQTKENVNVVDKSTFKDGELQKLREIIEPILNKQYIVCKY